MNRPACSPTVPPKAERFSTETAKPELLLPAGGFESVRAAVQNGGDAVYLGGKSFSARCSAENFDRNALSEAVSFCHARGVRVYQTLNTLVFDCELPEAEQTILAARDAGVDALIVQDWGILRLCRELLSADGGIAGEYAPRLHASTQMSIHTPAGARLLKEMGCSRVVLARELSISEIREITRTVDIETEVFVHGALCMSVSGQCYLSGTLGGRSGNRGRCAGTCRLPFTARNGKPGEGDYALSLKDLCLAEHIRELADAGVTSLKVEGRMKRPEYVAAAASAYRAALDGAAYDMDVLRAVFSRSGFTDGYYTEKRLNMFGVRQKDDVTAATSKLLKTLENSYQNEHGRVPLHLEFVCRAGEPCRLNGSDDNGHTATAAGMAPLTATGRPTDEASVSAALQKLGGTIFLPGHISARIEDGLYLPAAELNRLRREVCEELLRLRALPLTRSLDTASHASRIPVPITKQVTAKREPSSLAWRARFRSFSQLPLEQLEKLRFEFFSLPPGEVISHAESLLEWKGRLLVEPGRFLPGQEPQIRDLLLRLREMGFHRLLCQNLGHLALARELGLEAHGGLFLNCANSLSVLELESLDIKSQTLSSEGNLRDLCEIGAAIPLGIAIYGRLPLMLVRNCPVWEQSGCKACGGQGALTDRMGMRFPVVCSPGGDKRYAELLNSVPLWLADKLADFREFSYGDFTFTQETPQECREILARYERGLPYPQEQKQGAFTRGLYYRNV